MKAILESADGMHRSGLMDEGAHAKRTLRHLDKSATTAKPISD